MINKALKPKVKKKKIDYHFCSFWFFFSASFGGSENLTSEEERVQHEKLLLQKTFASQFVLILPNLGFIKVCK